LGQLRSVALHHKYNSRHHQHLNQLNRIFHPQIWMRKPTEPHNHSWTPNQPNKWYPKPSSNKITMFWISSMILRLLQRYNNSSKTKPTQSEMKTTTRPDKSRTLLRSLSKLVCSLNRWNSRNSWPSKMKISTKQKLSRTKWSSLDTKHCSMLRRVSLKHLLWTRLSQILHSIVNRTIIMIRKPWTICRCQIKILIIVLNKQLGTTKLLPCRMLLMECQLYSLTSKDILIINKQINPKMNSISHHAAHHHSLMNSSNKTKCKWWTKVLISRRKLETLTTMPLR